MSIEKEFVQYPEALELKELDYPQEFEYDGTWYYATLSNGELNSFCWTNDEDTPPSMFNPTIRPTYSQAFRWFREKHKLVTYIMWVYKEEGGIQWFYEVKGIEMVNNNFLPYEDSRFDTYEEAELACLQKLIEIVKTK